jgi:hypothetical protein
MGDTWFASRLVVAAGLSYVALAITGLPNRRRLNRT